MFSLFRNQNVTKPAETKGRVRRATPTISFSISFVRVCEGASDPKKFARPSEIILTQAAEHATRLGDKYILRKIEEAKTEWLLVDKTVTPKEFPKTKQRLPAPEKKPIKVVEEQSKRIAVFSSRGTYAPEKIVSSKSVEKKIEDEARVITTSYSLTPNTNEVIRVKDNTAEDRYLERAIYKVLDKI